MDRHICMYTCTWKYISAQIFVICISVNLSTIHPVHQAHIIVLGKQSIGWKFSTHVKSSFGYWTLSIACCLCVCVWGGDPIKDESGVNSGLLHQKKGNRRSQTDSSLTWPNRMLFSTDTGHPSHFRLSQSQSCSTIQTTLIVWGRNTHLSLVNLIKVKYRGQMKDIV